MVTGRKDPEFMRYFPDTFFKRTPPKEYFWKIYATIEPDSFKKKYDENLDRETLRINKPETLKIQEEHRQLLLLRKEENIKLAIALNKSGVAKNIIYLKKIKKTGNRNGTIEQYMQLRNLEERIPREQEDEEIYQDK